MAWNGSDGEKVKVKGQGQHRRDKNSSVHLISPPPPKYNYKALVAGLIVALGCGIAAYFILGRSGTGPEDGGRGATRPTAIAEVAPQIVTNAVQEAVAEKRKPRFWEVDASQTNGYTEVMMRKWKAAHRPPPAYTNDSSRYLPPPKYAIFKYRSENEIACLLTMEPGETLVGTPAYRGYTKDFLKSCEEPIVAEEGDDEYRRELKKMMNETKIEIRQRMADGEKLEDILSQTREEYQRLAQYKSALNAEFREFAKNPEHSDQDVEDFVNAANKVLEQKGIAPLKLGLITKRRLQNLKQEKEGNAK